MSAEIKKLKGEFLREALQRGWTAPCLDAGWLERAGRDRMERWFKQLYELPCFLPIPKDRFLNHFTLGADPEFVFMHGGQREDARHLGLKAGLAFGADNNGRLVELRPEPSRSALSVLTSIWLTMNWLAAYVPQTPNYIWRSGAYVENDGLGGHFHIGRKQERFRDREARALDRVVHLLYTAGCYNRDEGRLRVRQAQGGHYGMQSDIRPQPHGYEHRTFPSWLDTPWLAYLSATLTKLVVASELTPMLAQEDGLLTQEQARAQIRFLLAYFKGVDDDARLALTVLAQRGFPQHVQGGDLKINWGIFNGPLFSQKVKLPLVWPTSVPSVPALEHELAVSMLEGRLPEIGALQPTWVPNELPPGYRQMIHHLADTRLLPGIGEWLVDVCDHESKPIRVSTMNEGGRQLRFPVAVRALITRKGLAEKFNRLDIAYDFADINEYSIVIGAAHGNIRNMLAARDLIIKHELLPIWHIGSVREDSVLRWRKGAEGAKGGGSKPLSKPPEGPPPPEPAAPDPERAAAEPEPENQIGGPARYEDVQVDNRAPVPINTDLDGWADRARFFTRVRYVRADGRDAGDPLTGQVQGNGLPSRPPAQRQARPGRQQAPGVRFIGADIADLERRMQGLQAAAQPIQPEQAPAVQERRPDFRYVDIETPYPWEDEPPRDRPARREE